jgi:hypothetical protein
MALRVVIAGITAASCISSLQGLHVKFATVMVQKGGLWPGGALEAGYRWSRCTECDSA